MNTVALGRPISRPEATRQSSDRTEHGKHETAPPVNQPCVSTLQNHIYSSAHMTHDWDRSKASGALIRRAQFNHSTTLLLPRHTPSLQMWILPRFGLFL